MVEAHSGVAGLAEMKDDRFELIVSDIWMPEMDGIGLLKKLRSSGNNIPVVVISGGASNAPLTYAAPLASTFGANVVVHKPFENAELLNAVNSALRS